MFFAPLLALAAPTILETIAVAVGTTVATTVAIRLTNDAYDSAKKKEDDDAG